MEDFDSWWGIEGENLTKHEIGLKDLMRCAFEAKLKPNTVVCRRYQLDQAPGQDFYHYDKQPIYGSVPVTLDELIKMVESSTMKMPERKEDPGPVAGLSRKWAEGWNDALTEVGRLNEANQCAK